MTTHLNICFTLLSYTRFRLHELLGETHSNHRQPRQHPWWQLASGGIQRLCLGSITCQRSEVSFIDACGPCVCLFSKSDFFACGRLLIAKVNPLWQNVRKVSSPSFTLQHRNNTTTHLRTSAFLNSQISFFVENNSPRVFFLLHRHKDWKDEPLFGTLPHLNQGSIQSSRCLSSPTSPRCSLSLDLCWLPLLTVRRIRCKIRDGLTRCANRASFFFLWSGWPVHRDSQRPGARQHHCWW